MSTRRYGDNEVREIFTLATTGAPGDRALPAESGGLTLEELRHIAQEAGIDPSRVAQAAASLDARGRPTPMRRMLGLPVGMSRVVDLPRAPTDREWEQMITEFRTDFEVQGVSTASGSMREWSHGNLHISIEPTERGHQLRLRTLKDDAMALNVLAVLMGTMSVIMGSVVAAAGKPDKALVIFGMFGGMALAAFTANVLRLPRWARQCKQQIETLAEHAVKLLSNPQENSPRSVEPR